MWRILLTLQHCRHTLRDGFVSPDKRSAFTWAGFTNYTLQSSPQQRQRGAEQDEWLKPGWGDCLIVEEGWGGNLVVQSEGNFFIQAQIWNKKKEKNNITVSAVPQGFTWKWILLLNLAGNAFISIKNIFCRTPLYCYGYKTMAALKTHVWHPLRCWVQLYWPGQHRELTVFLFQVFSERLFWRGRACCSAEGGHGTRSTCQSDIQMNART